eukprot:scaffold12686_cov21-Tisochrysis_lutea.AAC.1
MECISQSSCTDGSNGAPCASQIELLNLGSRSANWQTTIANSSQAGPSTQVGANAAFCLHALMVHGVRLC